MAVCAASTQFVALVDQIIGASGNHEVVTNDGWLALYNNTVVKVFTQGFFAPQNITCQKIVNKYISVYPQGSVAGQCVSLVRIACTDLTPHVINWEKGASFSAGAPAKGTILATFNSAGKYDGGHTLVYWGSAGGTNHYVVDQNYFTGTQLENLLKKHILGATSPSGARLSALNNYNIVEI